MSHGPRHRVPLLLGVLALCGLLVGCTAGRAGSGPGTTAPPPGATASTATPPPPVRLQPNVATGAVVPVDTVVSVSASNGTVTSVRLTYRSSRDKEVAVEGTVAPDGVSWVAKSLLEPGVSYTLAMTGRNPQGILSTETSTFQTQVLSKKQQIYPTIVGDGATVGVAMPVIVSFDVPVRDKAAFERRMTVTSVPSQPGSWSWISSSEAHWRPQAYWQPGTKVVVKVDVHGVNAGNGTYGQVSRTGGFTVGQSVVMTADLGTHQMQVAVDGVPARTIPITGGKAGFETRSGTKVVMEKFASLHMDANTIGIEPGDPNYYDIPDVRWAMRETYSGEFVHAAPWSVASQGTVNVSHGCIGMSDENGQWLFGVAKVGDPVVVTGTSRGTEPGNGWTDWNTPFDQYRKGSALAG